MQKINILASMDKEVDQIVKGTPQPISARGLNIPITAELLTHTQSCKNINSRNGISVELPALHPSKPRRSIIRHSRTT